MKGKIRKMIDVFGLTNFVHITKQKCIVEDNGSLWAANEF